MQTKQEKFKVFRGIFKEASKTYYYSSLFFPKDIQYRVFTLYAFVRLFDDYVDSIPQNIDKFYNLKQAYYDLHSSLPLNVNNLSIVEKTVVEEFVDMEKELNLPIEWASAFLKSMEMDITKKVYLNLDQTEEYIYGSAGVIGLYMSKILNVPEKYYENAKKLGNAFQYINFIRDIDEDLKLGRNYFPQDQLIAFSLPDLQPKTVFNKPQYYIAFIESSIHQYYLWLEEGLEGIRALPKPFSIAVQTASDMYEWTAKKITKNPFIVYEKKMKPNKFNVVLKGIINTLKFNLRK